jgi:hypothetical protein
MAGANFIESQRAKMALVLVVDDVAEFVVLQEE